MKDTEVLNQFFAREELNESEQILKQKCIELKKRTDSLTEELKARRQELMQKEEELKLAASQFEILLQLALEQEKSRLAKQG